MDAEIERTLRKMTESHDKLLEQVLGLAALVGAIAEDGPPAVDRVQVWCSAVTRGEFGIHRQRVESVALGILRGLRTASLKAVD